MELAFCAVILKTIFLSHEMLIAGWHLAPYRAAMQALGKINLHQVVKECYRLTYRYSPPEFFTQYRVKGSTKLSDAVRLVVSVLLHNNLGSSQTAMSANAIARDLCEKFLWQRWHLVTADYRIQEPQDQRVLVGWKILEQSFPGGAKDLRVRDAIMSLLNQPYGYDYNTVTLLFCAWVGFHMHELQVSLQGYPSTLDGIAAALPGGGKAFVQRICSSQPLAISRRDQGQLVQEIKDLIAKANQAVYTQPVAKQTIALLKSYCSDQGLQPELCESASQAAINLENALSLAETYDKEAYDITQKINTERDLNEIISIQSKIATLPHLGNVDQTASLPSKLDQEWRTRLGQVVESECHKLENIQRTTQIELNQKTLDGLKKQLKKAKLVDLVNRVDSALEVIAAKSVELETKEREWPILVEINGMDIKAYLSSLYAYRERLKTIEGYSPATMEVCTNRLVAIEQEVGQLEAFAVGIIDSAQGLDTLTAVDDWQSKCLRQLNRYEGTKFHQDLESADECVRHIRAFLEELNHLTRQIPRKLSRR